MLHGLVPMPNAGSHTQIVLPAVSDAPMSSITVACPSAHVQEPGVPGSSTVRTVRSSTAEPHSQFSLTFCTFKSCLSFQLGVSRIVHSFINVIMGNHDASATFVRFHHRSWMRRAKFANSWISLWVTRALIAVQCRRLGRRARFHPRASIV